MSVHPFDFYKAFLRRIQPPPALPNRFLEYFATRGITSAIIAEAQAIPLTADPSEQEIAWYAQHVRSPRCNTKGDPAPCVVGIGFPYFVNVDQYGRFGRIRGLEWGPDFLSYYAERQETPPRYLSPSRKKVNCTSHLYILPTDSDKLKRASSIVGIIEGEGKTLALSQDFRELDDDTHTYAAVGIAGVEQFLSSPEIQEISWRNRTVYIFFDADSLRKPQVAQAELKIAAWLLSRGVRAVRSCVWVENEGNGYDDFQVNASNRFPRSRTLNKLIKKSVPTLRKYAGSDDVDGLPIDTYCRAFGRVPSLRTHHADILIEELAKIFQKQGIKKKAIKDLLNEEIRKANKEASDKEIEEAKQRIMELFEIDYIPDLPDSFYARNGSLAYLETPLCNMFLVKKYIATSNPDTEDYYLLKFQGAKEIEIPSSEFTQYKKIAERFNRNQEILHDGSAKLVQRFISEYWLKNKHKPIPIVQKFVNTGWEDGIFRLPTLDAESEYEGHIKDRFFQRGDPDLQTAFLAQVYRLHNAAFYDLCAKVAPLIGLLNLPNCIILTTGTGGGGKTTGALLALSQFGHYKKLKFTMDSTKTGKEIVCSLYKDMPILIDEMNTAGDGDGTKTAAAIIATIYGFESGQGKLRGTTNVTLRKVNEYQGLLFLTAEKSLDTILSATKNMVVGGAYRRVLEIPVKRKHTLWKFKDEQEKSFFDGIYQALSNNFGYTGAAWLRHIADPAAQHAIKERYAALLKEFGKQWTLKGTENLICLIKAIMPDVENLLDLPSGTIERNLNPFIEEVLQYNQQQIEYQIQNTVERFLDCLDDFMSDNTKAFDGLCPREELMSKIYGKFEPDADPKSDKKDVWLRTTAMDLICNEYALNKNALLHQLQQEGILETSEVTEERKDAAKIKTVWTVNKWIINKAWKCYHFRLNYPDPVTADGTPDFDAMTETQRYNLMTDYEREQWDRYQKIIYPKSEVGKWWYKSRIEKRQA